MKSVNSGPYPDGAVVFVSFFTPNYKVYADRLIKSLKEFDLHYDICAIEGKRGWDAAVRSKPQFLLDTMKAHPKAKVLVWLDADAELRQHPGVLFRLKCTMAAPVIHSIKCPEGRFQANVIYMANVPAMTKLLERWAAHMEKAQKEPLHCPEQEIFDRLRVEGLGLRFLELPEPYSHRLRDSDSTAVIFQHQVSRKHRDPAAWKVRIAARKEDQAKAKGVPKGGRGKVLESAKTKSKIDKDKRG